MVRMLETEVHGLEYNFVSHVGRLYMARGCCCDMAACINFFRGLDPHVECIRTFAGIQTDTAYHRLLSGKWQATAPGGVEFEPCEIPAKSRSSVLERT